MLRRPTALLRTVVDAALTAVGGLAIGVAIVVVGLGLLDEEPYRGAATESAYLAVAAAAVAVAGSGALVAVIAATAAVRAARGRA